MRVGGCESKRGCVVCVSGERERVGMCLNVWIIRSGGKRKMLREREREGEREERESKRGREKERRMRQLRVRVPSGLSQEVKAISAWRGCVRYAPPAWEIAWERLGCFAPA